MEYVGQHAFEMGRRQFNKALGLLPVLLANPFKGVVPPTKEHPVAVLEAPSQLWRPGDHIQRWNPLCDHGYFEFRSDQGTITGYGLITKFSIQCERGIESQLDEDMNRFYSLGLTGWVADVQMIVAQPPVLEPAV